MRILSSTRPFGVAFGLAFGLALTLAVGACATSTKAYLGDEGGIDGGDEGGDPDGGTLDGATEDGGADGSVGAPRIPCGATTCRSDQTCMQGACNFDCKGTKIPGDYATITAAVTALAATGNDVTICLGAVQAGESVSISDPAAHNKAVRIIGIAPQQVTLGSVTVGAGFSDVTLAGFGTSATMTVQNATKVTLRALKLSSPSSAALNLRASSGTMPTTIVVDGCDIGNTTTSGYAVSVDSSATSPFEVSVTNSYLHGGSYGIYASGTSAQMQLSIINNTIDKTANGIYLASAATAKVTYVNNIISNSTMFGVHVTTGATAVTHSNNALFGNTNNYSGVAVEGMGYVKTDCMLDTSTGIPQTKAGSPCRGVGRDEGAPAVDYWNAPRGPKIDLGAVQGP